MLMSRCEHWTLENWSMSGQRARTQAELASVVEQAARESLAGPRLGEIMRRCANWREITGAIKHLFGDLGMRLEYFVAASGFRHADAREWLYDMIWYSESEDRLFSRVALVLESELNPGGGVRNAAEIDGDFCKLVQARADLRVWLALLPNRAAVELHLRNCKRQARGFAGAAQGDAYLFVIYDWTSAETLVERFDVDLAAPPQIEAQARE